MCFWLFTVEESAEGGIGGLLMRKIYNLRLLASERSHVRESRGAQ